MAATADFHNVFVTVGTTQFNALIDAINTSEVAAALRRLGLRQLTVQIGSGHDHDLSNSTHYKGIQVEVYSLKPTIKPDISSADLIISHAGAGTCLDVLTGKNVPLVVVVNDQLMDNHQTELADQLASEGYIVACKPDGLAKQLSDITRAQFQPYVPGSAKPFVSLLNRMMNFE